MTRNLVLKGNLEKPIFLWNRTKDRAAEHSLRIGHSVVVETAEEAVSNSDIIWTCLATQEAVISLFEIIMKKDITGKLFLECSTMTPESTNALAEKVLNAGGEFVAMPGMLDLLTRNTRPCF